IPQQERLVAPRNTMGFFPEIRNEIERTRTVVNRNKLEIALEETRLVHSASHKLGILVFYEAWNAFDHGAMRSGVLLAWIAIEIMLDVEVRAHLIDQGLSSVLAERISDGFNAFQALELLRSEAKAGRFIGS